MTDDLAVPPDRLKKSRPCGDCTMCCKLIGVGEPLNKPMNTWCKHCTIGKGCQIYDDRPKECQEFYCGWKYGIGDTRPDKSKVVIGIVNEDLAVFYVDEGRPDAWKEPEFRELLRVLKKTTIKKVIIDIAGKKRQQIVFEKTVEGPLEFAI